LRNVILANIAHMFDNGAMMSSVTGHRNEARAARDQDQLTVARLTSAAQRHAPPQPPTAAETAAAVAELREIAGGRGDLLAEVAGLLTGYFRGTAEEMRAGTAARLCRAAGADTALISRWTAEGERRAAVAHEVPAAS
jgi:hypothetical protein